jgi:hypothetical protein
LVSTEQVACCIDGRTNAHLGDCQLLNQGSEEGTVLQWATICGDAPSTSREANQCIARVVASICQAREMQSEIWDRRYSARIDDHGQRARIPEFDSVNQKSNVDASLRQTLTRLCLHGLTEKGVLKRNKNVCVKLKSMGSQKQNNEVWCP